MKKINSFVKSDKLYLFYIFSVFMIPWIVYLKTHSTTITIGDNGELIAAPYVLGIPHPTGYPTFCLIGKLFSMIFPFGSIGNRINLFPALLACLGSVFIFLLLLEITKNKHFSIIGAIFFDFTKIFWSQAISAEVYTMNIFLGTAWILYLVRWTKTYDNRNIYSFAFFYTLGVTNHMTVSLAAPAILYIFILHLKKLLNFKTLVIMALITMIIFSAYCYLPMRSATTHEEIMSSMLWGDQTKFIEFKRHLSGSAFQGLMFSQPFLQVLNNLKIYLFEFNQQYYLPIILIIILGMIKLFFDDFHLFIFTSIIFFTDLVFSINYKIEDINVFYLPSLMMALIWLIKGFSIILAKKKRIAIILVIFLVTLPFFTSYYPNDLQNNFVSYDYGTSVLNSVEKGSALFSAGWIVPFIFSYLKLVEEKGEDISIKVDDIGSKVKGMLFNPIYPDGIKPEKEPPIYTYVPFEFPENPEFDPIPYGPCYIVRSELKSDKGQFPLWWGSTLRGSDDPKVYKDFQTTSLIATCYYLEGETYYQEKYPIEAIQLYDKAVEVAIDNKQLFNNLGTLYEKKGWLNKAKEAFSIALILDPGFLHAKKNLANIYYKMGEFNKALSLYNSIADNKFGTDKELVFLRIGDMYLDKGDYNRALNQYKTALERYPASIEARESLAKAYIMVDNYEKAIEIYKDIIYIKPDNYMAHNNLGFVYQRMNLINDARDEYKKSIRIDKEYLDAYLNLANTYNLDQNWLESEKILMEALNNIKEQSPVLLNSLGCVYMNLKEYLKGLEYFKKSITVNPKYKVGYQNLSIAYEKIGDKVNAKLASERFDDLDSNDKPDNIQIH